MKSGKYFLGLANATHRLEPPPRLHRFNHSHRTFQKCHLQTIFCNPPAVFMLMLYFLPLLSVMLRPRE